MRRAVVTSAATAAGVVLLLSLKPHEAPGPAPVIGSGSGSGTGTDVSEPSNAPTASASAAPTGATRKVSGDTVNTRYGPVQVQVTLSGSRITAVDVVKYPTSERRDREINTAALPVLNKEAVSAQSARIDVVSGATYTSDGYIRSLQSALDRAKG